VAAQALDRDQPSYSAPVNVGRGPRGLRRLQTQVLDTDSPGQGVLDHHR
jgi:hypothetical protein